VIAHKSSSAWLSRTTCCSRPAPPRPERARLNVGTLPSVNDITVDETSGRLFVSDFNRGVTMVGPHGGTALRTVRIEALRHS